MFKRHITRVSLFTVNYCLFANDDVSIRFNGKDDDVVLECFLYSQNLQNYDFNSIILYYSLILKYFYVKTY